MHQDIYDDRIAVTSPGGMYSGQQVQDIPLEEVSSNRRNPVLADVMAQLDYMEKRGSGLKRICNETKALESYKDDRRPVFKSSPSQFMTVIYSMEYDGGLNGQLNGQLNGGLNGQLNDSQKETFEFIKAHEGYNTTRIAEGLGKPFRTIVKHINVLLELNMIERRGSKKTGGYYVK